MAACSTSQTTVTTVSELSETLDFRNGPETKAEVYNKASPGIILPFQDLSSIL